ncbi:unnamed protein product [Brassica oleracea]
MAKSSILLAYSKTGSCSSTVKVRLLRISLMGFCFLHTPSFDRPMCCSQESRIVAISVHMIHQDPNCSYSLVHPIASHKGRSKKDKKTTINQNRGFSNYYRFLSFHLLKVLYFALEYLGMRC